MGGKYLKYLESGKYLGIILNRKLNWGDHINEVVSKGNKNLNFVMRNLRGCSSHVRNKAYTEIVKPTLEYASCIWDPHTKYQKEAIEKVQRRAAHKVLGKYGRMYSASEMIKDLEWKSLEDRRKFSKLCAVYKAQSGQPAWSEINKRLKAATFIGKNDHRNKLTVPRFRTEVGKNSFVGSATRIWNGLDKTVLTPLPNGIAVFKNRLKNCY